MSKTPTIPPFIHLVLGLVLLLSALVRAGAQTSSVRFGVIGLVAPIEFDIIPADFSFVGRQCGMFSYSGLTVEQVTRLRTEFGIYALDTGRICVAALNQSNIDVVTKAIVQVI